MPDMIHLGGYIISFLGADYNNGLQTWTYSLTKKDTPISEIMSWALELCYKPLHNVANSSGPGSVIIGQGKPCIPLSGRAIQWEALNNANVEGIYTITLEGCYEHGEKHAAIYAGPFCFRGFITGPSCQEKIIEDLIVEKAADVRLEETLETQGYQKVNPEQLDDVKLQEQLTQAEQTQDIPTYSNRGIKIF